MSKHIHHYHNREPQFPHFLHFVMTLVTAGLWFPLWILHYIFRSR